MTYRCGNCGEDGHNRSTCGRYGERSGSLHPRIVKGAPTPTIARLKAQAARDEILADLAERKRAAMLIGLLREQRILDHDAPMPYIAPTPASQLDIRRFPLTGAFKDEFLFGRKRWASRVLRARYDYR